MGKEIKVILHDAEKEREREREFWKIVGKFILFVVLPFGLLLLLTGLIIKDTDISFVVALFLYFVGVIIYKRMKKRNKEHPHRERFKEAKGFVKSYFIWFIAFTIGITISYFIRKIYLTDIKVIWFVVLSGFIIEVCSKIMQIFVLHKKWIVDGRFLFWVVMQMGLFYLSYFIISKSQEYLYTLAGNYTAPTILSLVLMGIIQTILIHIIWRLNIEGELFR